MPQLVDPALAFLPDYGGTASSYGIDVMDMSMAASLLPGGGSRSAAIDPEWIVPGNQPRVGAPSFLDGLGCGMADFVPGQPRGMGDSSSAQSSSASTSNATAYGGTSNVQIQVPQPKGMLEGDQGPILIALAGIGVLGAILLKKG